MAQVEIFRSKMIEIDDILECAVREGLIFDHNNFEVLAAICNCSTDVIRGFALGVSHRFYLDINHEGQASVESLKAKKGLLEGQLSQIESALQRKRKLEDDARKRKRIKVEVKVKAEKSADLELTHEYVPAEIPPPKPKLSPEIEPTRKRKTRVRNKNRKSVLVRVRLYCAHCDRFFYAKPTKRVNLHVLNHQCNGEKRKQFVVGRHHRRCAYNHPEDVACIDFAPKGWEAKFGREDIGQGNKMMTVKKEIQLL